MQAYYDEDRKVWVFPGEDPDEKAKPIGPPPIVSPVTPMKPSEMTAITNTSTTNVSHDPLAAMMAPPTRLPPSVNRQRVSTTMTTPSAPGTISGHGTEVQTPIRPVAPPQFSVFQPTPQTSS